MENQNIATLESELKDLKQERYHLQADLQEAEQTHGRARFSVKKDDQSSLAAVRSAQFRVSALRAELSTLEEQIRAKTGKRDEFEAVAEHERRKNVQAKLNEIRLLGLH